MRLTGFVLSILFLTGLAAQTVETIPFRAVLSNTNEVPATTIAASGGATVLLHVVRDASGNILSGSADANVSYKFPGAVTITAMHIHKAPAGVNGSIVLPWTIMRTEDASGVGSLAPVQSQFPSTAIPVDIVNQILADPSQFYLNVHTGDFPGGAMRGQLQPAQMIVRIGIMRPENETPAISGQPWTGISTVTTYLTRDASGNPTSAQVIFDFSYAGFPDGATFTGYHIHLGSAAVAGPVTISSGIPRMPVGSGGSGKLHFEVEPDVTLQPVIDTLNAILYNPGATYVNVHTTDYPGGAMRGQLLATDRADFQVTMSTANEVPAITDLQASAPAVVSAYTARNQDGTAAAGAVVFDINPRFPAGTGNFTGLHIHDQVAGQNGPVTIDSGLNNSPQLHADGTGNIFRIATVPGTGLASLNSLLVNPEKHYVNIHTTTKPGGAVRSQLMPANTANPRVTFVETAVQDPSITRLAPGGLTLLAGSNLSKVAGTLDGFNGNAGWPTALNGSSLTIGGQQAPLLSVAPDRIFAQVPFEVTPGSQPAVVTNSNGQSSAYNVTVMPAAPAAFFDGVGALAYRLSDGSRVSPDNPAKAGDAIYIAVTGLGVTVPAQQTGVITASNPPYGVAAPIAVTIGGQKAQVVAAGAAPGYVGVYVVAVLVPGGVTPGNAPVVVQSGSVTSNVTSIAVQ